jgi:3-oxoacyl-(acyl-carrier-protein) synthase
VCLHGDGSPAHERAESEALARALGGRLAGLPRLRMKAAHGDLGAAACPVELLACSATLRHAMIPPVVSSASEAPAAIPRTSALVLSLGLFGESAALMIGTAGDSDAR